MMPLFLGLAGSACPRRAFYWHSLAPDAGSFIIDDYRQDCAAWTGWEDVIDDDSRISRLGMIERCAPTIGRAQSSSMASLSATRYRWDIAAQGLYTICASSSLGLNCAFQRLYKALIS